MSFEYLRRVRGTVGVRLTAGFVLLLLVSLSMLFILTDWQMRRALQIRDRATINTELMEMVQEYESDGLLALEEEARETQAVPIRRRIYIRLIDAAGQARWERNWPQQALRSLRASGIPESGSWIHVPTDEDEVLEVTTHRLPDGMYLQVGASTEARKEALEAFRETFALATLPVLLLGLLGGLFSARRILSPLREFASVTRHIAATGEVKDRIPYRGTDDELDELTLHFNGMLERIALLLTGMRATLDNVAHDLRTPMTRLRGRAELALHNMAATSKTYQDALNDTLDASEQVLAILNAIMDEAEAEAGTLPIHPQNLSLRKLADEVVELYQYVAEDRGVQLEVSGDQRVDVVVDPSRMRQAIANLIDNALKFTQSGGRVDVEVGSEESFATLRVRNTGRGITATDLPRIWDRLYRGDHSRSTRGLGLGLSLVKAIVEVHNGQVKVTSVPDECTTFTIRLPYSED